MIIVIVVVTVVISAVYEQGYFASAPQMNCRNAECERIDLQPYRSFASHKRKRGCSVLI